VAQAYKPSKGKGNQNSTVEALCVSIAHHVNRFQPMTVQYCWQRYNNTMKSESMTVHSQQANITPCVDRQFLHEESGFRQRCDQSDPSPS